jgi:prophage tail gpP-like protein
MPDLLDNDKIRIYMGPTLATLVPFEVQSARIVRAYNAAVHSFSATFPYKRGENPLLDRSTVPFAWAQVYIGGELILTGRLFWENYRNDRRSIVWKTRTQNLLDCVVVRPYQVRRGTLLTHCQSQSLAYLVKSYAEPNAVAAASKPLRNIVVESLEQRAFDWLRKTAKERGVILGTDRLGNLVLRRHVIKPPFTAVKEATKSEPFGTPATGFEITYDYSKFHDRTAFFVSKNFKYLQAFTNYNPTVPDRRTIRYEARDVQGFSLREAATFAANRQQSSAYDIPLTFAGYRDVLTKKIWSPGDVVSVTSETIGVKAEPLFIEATEHIQDDGIRRTVVQLTTQAAYLP